LLQPLTGHHAAFSRFFDPHYFITPPVGPSIKLFVMFRALWADDPDSDSGPGDGAAADDDAVAVPAAEAIAAADDGAAEAIVVVACRG
jgi:hypothetical protein